MIGNVENSRDKLKKFAVDENNKLYQNLIERKSSLYSKENDIRSPFARDYTRILHSTAYRRLKHKTQVFYNVESDHICTRMEHVLHVESVSYTIAKHLGLNEELTKAIAIGHDLGHPPFGHFGEEVINELNDKYLKKSFWHEKNGLYLVDKLELLPDHKNQFRNLDLTYAVRDGIISHCGENDIESILPRKELIDLSKFEKVGEYSPATFEGCVVKMSDKIAYVGRDIEDAINLGFLSEKDLQQLTEIVKLNNSEVLNTSTIMKNLILDVCENSSSENGISLSKEKFEMLNKIKRFNYSKIYSNSRFEPFKKYARLIIFEIFETLVSCYNANDLFDNLNKSKSKYHTLISEFISFISKYCCDSILPNELKLDSCLLQNEKIYGDFSQKTQYVQAVLDFIAGMTDRYAVKLFNELISF